MTTSHSETPSFETFECVVLTELQAKTTSSGKEVGTLGLKKGATNMLATLFDELCKKARDLKVDDAIVVTGKYSKHERFGERFVLTYLRLKSEKSQHNFRYDMARDFGSYENYREYQDQYEADMASRGYKKHIIKQFDNGTCAYEWRMTDEEWLRRGVAGTKSASAVGGLARALVSRAEVAVRSAERIEEKPPVRSEAEGSRDEKGSAGSMASDTEEGLLWFGDGDEE